MYYSKETVVPYKEFETQFGKDMWDANEVTIKIPSLPRPSLDMINQKIPDKVVLDGTPAWNEMEFKKITMDTSPTEEITMKLGSVFPTTKKLYIDDQDLQHRINSVPAQILIGYQHALWLVEHQDELPNFLSLLDLPYRPTIACLGIRAEKRVGIPEYPQLIRFKMGSELKKKRWFIVWHWFNWVNFYACQRIGLGFADEPFTRIPFGIPEQ